MAKRSSSSMAVLALLSIDRWTPYEFVQHMKRSTIHFIWPGAESKVCEELKRLAAAGYARATADRKDPRRTHYAISAAGRSVLSDWLAEPGSGVFFESEGALKVLFAENGTKEQLLATINSIAPRRSRPSRTARVFEDVVHDGPPYPIASTRACSSSTSSTRPSGAGVEWADSAEARVDADHPSHPTPGLRDAAIRLVADIRDLDGTMVAAHRPDADAALAGALHRAASILALELSIARARGAASVGVGQPTSPTSHGVRRRGCVPVEFLLDAAARS